MFEAKPQPSLQKNRKRYISVNSKFWIGHLFAFLWMLFAIIVSIPWVNDLSLLVGKIAAVFIIVGIAYLPGYINAFMVTSLLMDRQPPFKTLDPRDAVTIVVPCMNEEEQSMRLCGI